MGELFGKRIENNQLVGLLGESKKVLLQTIKKKRNKNVLSLSTQYINLVKCVFLLTLLV